MKSEDLHRYDDIIDMPRPVSKKHPPMSLYDRAAQFAPFAALTGHEAAIKETARLTEQMTEMSEDMLCDLDEKLQEIAASPDLLVTVTYFVPDEKKDGGAFAVCTGTVKKIDGYRRALFMADKTEIPIDRIRAIECESPLCINVKNDPKSL